MTKETNAVAANGDAGCPTDLVAVVIVNHDQWLRVIDQLAAHYRDDAAAFSAVQWFVVHNGPDRVESIASMYPNRELSAAMERVELIVTENRGYGAAVNLAASRTARPFLLAMNADILPVAGFMRRVLRVAESTQRMPPRRSRTGLIGFRLVNADGTPQGSVGEFPKLSRFLAGQLRPRSIRKYLDMTGGARRTVDWATGACMLIARNCFDEVGGFDEQYFLYYEDVDLCRRARRAGWEVHYDPSASCQHLFPYHARRLTPRMVYVARRALLLYYWKHRPAWEFRALSAIVRAECWFRRGNLGWRLVGAMIRDLLRDPSCHHIGPGDLPKE